MADDYRKTTLKKLILDFDREDKKYCFILGAGASRQSGIRTGGELAKAWINQLFENDPTGEEKKWIDGKGINQNNAGDFYSQIYEKRFELNSQDGYDELQKEMEGKEPSLGYSVLAQILAKLEHNLVITTNFDSLTEDALFIYTQKKPLIIGHESLCGYLTISLKRPIIAKIHRDLLLNPKSSEQETKSLSENWIIALTEVFKTYTPLVIGYGGNDGSLMGFLEGMENTGLGMFWCHLENEIPNDRIMHIVKKQNGWFIPIEGFDEMMLLFNESLDYKLLDEEMKKTSEERVDEYRKQVYELREKVFGKTGESEKPVDITDVFKSLEKTEITSWLDVVMKAVTEKDIKKKEAIYKLGLGKFPENAEIMLDYAIFLEEYQKEYNKADEYYKKALEIAPNHANILSNYARFMWIIKQNYDKAEDYYQKSLKIDPSFEGSLGNYALFLYNIRKDYDKAEEYYKKAL
ncbi:MAG: hypothetical protein A2014_04060, partial [Spirochaetes bacterium GWF1_49_6]